MRRILLLLTVLACSFVPLLAAGKDVAPPEQKAEAERKLALLELYNMSNELPRRLIDLQNGIEKLRKAEGIESELPGFEQEIKDLEWEVNIAESTPNISYHQLALIDSKLEKTRLRIDALNSSVRSNVDLLHLWYREWLKKEETYLSLQNSEKVIHLSAEVKDTENIISEVIGKAKELLEKTLIPNILAGKKIGEIQTRVYSLNEMIVNLIEDTNSLRVQQTSPSMLSAEFYERLDSRVFKESWENLRLFFMYQWGYIKQNPNWVFGALFVIGLLTLLIRVSKRLVTPYSHWHVFASKPFVTAVFLSCTLFSTFSSLVASLSLPPDWETLMHLPLIVAVACFSDQILDVRWQNLFLRRLIIFLAVTVLLTIINVPPPVFHLFVLYAAVAVFCVSFYRFIQRWRDPKVKTVTWAIWLWGLFPLVIIVAGISGYDQLAVLLFGRVLVLVTATITIWITLQMVSGLLEMVLDYFPVHLVKNNSKSIVRQLFPFLIIIHGVWWLAVTLMVFWVHPTLAASFEALTSFTFKVSTFTLTPGSILIVIFVCYSTVLCSRAIRAFLMQEVLPRYGAEKGVQVSITRLVHYATLTVGFLILLRILGFGLNQIAIVGGALSVGIGFGLQTIVNNFVSGLILLFERPIKVGDMIDVGGDLGEVKELGLRATTVQTFDNAEIVIPNSELISASVTNWTLAEKRARVKVPVGVAYGSDIEKVLGILLECGGNNPAVLSTPAPKALFLAFGASSLDFELRVWIPDVNDRLEILSQLNLDIENEFQIAGIEIPFPQTDLHVRSLDNAVADRIVNSFAGEKQP